MFYVEKKIYCDGFNASFSTFVNTLFIYSLNASSSFLFLGRLIRWSTNVKLNIEIIARCLNNCSRQKHLPDNFLDS